MGPGPSPHSLNYHNLLTILNWTGPSVRRRRRFGEPNVHNTRARARRRHTVPRTRRVAIVRPENVLFSGRRF